MNDENGKESPPRWERRAVDRGLSDKVVKMGADLENLSRRVDDNAETTAESIKTLHERISDLKRDGDNRQVRTLEAIDGAKTFFTKAIIRTLSLCAGSFSLFFWFVWFYHGAIDKALTWLGVK